MRIIKISMTSLALCFSIFSCDNVDTKDTNSSFTQEGVTEVREKGPIEVFYPIPFSSAPNLTFPTREFVNFGNPIEQRPDGFRLNIDSFGPASPAKFHWKAEGVRGK